MVPVYNTAIAFYGLIIKTASFFNPKAKLWVKGRENIFENLRGFKNEKKRVVWFHCASLGEFEQGRPVIEEFRNENQEWKIVVTFFSPSGYEIRKNFTGADLVCYLPLDTKKNAERFIQYINPSLAIFIKYEFWFHYLETLSNKNIPTFLISANFRGNQPFFKWYGRFWRTMLIKFDHIFTQDEMSAQRLKELGINAVTVAGDTRFDRVLNIASNPRSINLITEFKGANKLFVAGSTWPKDEHVLFHSFLSLRSKIPNLKLVIAPHELNALERFSKIKGLKIDFYSKASAEDVNQSDVLVIDNIGMLSSLYQYADIAYIGGGFDKGIHNILEATAFGKPVIFGPNNKKFIEATELIKEGGAFEVTDEKELSAIITFLLKQGPDKYEDLLLGYMHRKSGAKAKVVTKIKALLPAS